MTPKTLRSNAGFTYIAALVMVVLTGIMLAKGAEVWSTKMQREREVELLFRGTQVRTALQRYYKYKEPAPGMPQPPPVPGVPALTELKDLLKDNKSAGAVRYLRPSNLMDPMTPDKEWDVIKDGARIVGVKSRSEREPLKKANFPDEYLDFEGKKSYKEWEFIYNRIPQKVTAGSQKGLDPSNPSGK